MTDEQETNHADARSRSNVGLERQQFEAWATDGRRLGDMEKLFAWEAWKAATAIEREACAMVCENASTDGYGYLPYVADTIRKRSNVELRGAHYDRSENTEP
jgi:hypothetical protein